MNKRACYLFGIFGTLAFFTWGFSIQSDDNGDEFAEKVKIVLRDVGNQLLLAQQDSTSLVLPVIVLDELKYELSFENKLSLEPRSLVSLIEESFQKLKLPKNYRVEVIQCLDREVAYSYELNLKEERTIIPCFGRYIPESCYTIEVKFLHQEVTLFDGQKAFYVFACSIFLAVVFVYRKRKKQKSSKENGEVHESIGSFRFYPERNVLVKEAIEINLSRKECELLAIFVARPNEIIKRDELTKKVWEDNGVFVGRSLDTYISKLRKKLRDDDTIKLTNIHGVGYKLEING